MVQNTISRNITNLQDLGDVSYQLARPILKQITNPEHLRQLELVSPQIEANDSEMWIVFIRRDIPTWREHIGELKTDRITYDVYCELKKRDEQEREQQEEQLRQAFAKADQKKEANKSIILDKAIRDDENHTYFVGGKFRNLSGRTKDYKAADFAPSLRNAKGGQIIKALRKQSHQAMQQKKLSQPFGAKPLAPPPTIHETKGQRSLRMAMEVESRKKAEVERRKEVKKIVRKERAKETNTQSAPATPASQPTAHVIPNRRPTPPQEAYLSPPPNPNLPQPGDTPRKPSPPSERSTPSPFRSSVSPFKKPTTPPVGPDPAALERKSGSPIPQLALNEAEKPKVPVYFVPAAARRPVSIFAPKPKRQRA